MRNREAARYARWSAIAAGLIVLGVAGAYIYRAVQRVRTRRAMPAAVPASVERRSAQFAFSKVEQNRTVFTIRASEATQYKDDDRAILQDVWITIYGRDASRNDNIHTRECSYDPQTGGARCEGSVQIDIGAAKKAAAGSGSPPLTLTTSDMRFDRDSGNASTDAPVQFTFPGGSGSGVGLDYKTHDATVRLEHSIEFRLDASERTGGLPVSASGSSLEIHRDDRTAVLNGPVSVRQGQRELSAAKISVVFDAANRARQVLIEGNPRIRANESGSDVAISAAQFGALLNPGGWVELVTADGNVHASRHTKAVTGSLSAGHVEFAMVPRRNLVQEMTATGDVNAQSRQGEQAYTLRSNSLRLHFAADETSGRLSGKAAPSDIAREKLASAETLAPGTIEMAKRNETILVKATKFVAQANADGRIEKLFGHSGVTIQRTAASGAPQIATAPELTATLGAGGQWATVEETGGVRMQQAERQATANSARIDRATNAIELAGSPTVMDGESRTTADAMTFNQKSGGVQASGGVVSTYLPAGGLDAVSLGAGAAHISAQTLTGSANAGHVTYAGHVRLWQGESVLEADRIDLWRDEKKLVASGNVVAVFPQSAGPSIPNFAKLGSKPARNSAPDLWKIYAPQLTYWADQGKASLEGGVVASSSQGTLQSQTLDVYLGSTPPKSGAATAVMTQGAALQSFEAASSGGGRQLDKVIARGGVMVAQGQRHGRAERAEYTASDGKFVLSGGEPTVTDGSNNTATGSSLTFYVASDTISIDSQEGSRTLTKHKVEK